MSSPTIEGFLIDAENEQKFADHGLSAREVVQVLDNEHLVVRNRKRRRGSYLILGRDHGSSCIAVPVERTNDPRIWRPVTAWRCKDHERQQLERRAM